MSQTLQCPKKSTNGPRPAITYRANRKSLPKAQRQSLATAARRLKPTKSWPNPVNPTMGVRECERRITQAAWSTMFRHRNPWISSSAVGAEAI